MLVSAAGVVVIGWVGSYAAEKGVEWVMNTETVRNVLIGIGNTIWDWLKGTSEEQQPPRGQGGPFDEQPENGNGNGNGNGQMCPIPGRGNGSGGDRYQGLKPIKLL